MSVMTRPSPQPVVMSTASSPITPLRYSPGASTTVTTAGAIPQSSLSRLAVPTASSPYRPPTTTTTTTTTTTKTIQSLPHEIPSAYVSRSLVPTVTGVENPLGNGPITFTPPTWEFSNRAIHTHGKASGITKTITIPTAPAFTPVTQGLSQTGEVKSLNQKHPKAWVTTPVEDKASPFKLRPRGFSLSTYESGVTNSTDWDVKSRYMIAMRSGPTECPDHILCKSRLFPKDEFTSPYVLYYFDETAPNELLLKNDVIKDNRNHKKSSSKGFCGMGSSGGTKEDFVSASTSTTSSSVSRTSSASSSDMVGGMRSVSSSRKSSSVQPVQSVTMRPRNVADVRQRDVTASTSSYTSSASRSKSRTTYYSSAPGGVQKAVPKSQCCGKGKAGGGAATSSYNDSYYSSSTLRRYNAMKPEDYVMTKPHAMAENPYVSTTTARQQQSSSSSSMTSSSSSSAGVGTTTTSKGMTYSTGYSRGVDPAHASKGPCGGCCGAGRHSTDLGASTYTTSYSSTSSSSMRDPRAVRPVTTQPVPVGGAQRPSQTTSCSSCSSSITDGRRDSGVSTHKHVCRACGDAHTCQRRVYSAEVRDKGYAGVAESVTTSSYVSSSGESSTSHTVDSRSKSRVTASSASSSYRNPYIAHGTGSYSSSSSDSERAPMLAPPSKSPNNSDMTYTLRHLFVDVDDLRVPKHGTGLKMLPMASVSYRNYPVLCYQVVAPTKYGEFFRVRKCPGMFA